MVIAVTTATQRVAIYTRISQDADDDRQATERQEADCRSLADTRGYVIGQVFCDNGYSASTGRRRPQFESMLAAAADRQFDVIMAWATDRLWRLPEDMERVAATRVPVDTYASGYVDWDNADQCTSAGILGYVHKGETRKMSQRRRRANQQRAENGLHHCCARPFGYLKNGMVPHPAEAREVARMASEALAGVSLRAIARDLQDRGVPNSRGVTNRWTSGAVKRILVSPRHAALRVHRGEVIGPAAWPPILADTPETARDIHDALTALLCDPARRRNHPRGPVPQTLGSRLYRCATCQAPTMIRNGPAYVCSLVHGFGNPRGTLHPARRLDLLDAYIEGQLVGLLSQPGVIEAMIGTVDTGDVDIDELRAERTTLQRELDDMIELRDTGDITVRMFADATRRIRHRLEKIEILLRERVTPSPLQVFFDSDDPAAVVWAGLTLGKKRAVLELMLTVTLYPGRAPNRLAEVVDVQLAPQARVAGVPAMPAFTPPPTRTANHVLTPAERQQVRARYAAGESRQNISADMGVSTQTVWQITKCDTLTDGRNSHRVAFTPEQDAQIRARYANGEPVKSIAADLGVSPSTIYNRVRGTRLTDGRANQHAALSAEQVQQVRAMRAAGATLKAIADHFGVSEWPVRRVLPPGDLRRKEGVK